MMKTISFRLNGEVKTCEVEPNLTLLDLIRGKMHVTGPKKSCERGECGACTVLLNGKAVNACLVLAISVDGKEVMTVEGLGSPEKLHLLQKRFVEMGASQCGYCTPGMLLSAKYLLDKNPNPTVEDIKKGISGNLCRCTGYVKIIEAIQAAAEEMRQNAVN
jgi:carbon-monoxide dehydrogenase small subunit